MNDVLPPCSVVERWVQAMDAHDIETAVACFHADYHDEAPARRGERVVGREKIRENFSRLFPDLPDLGAELVGCVTKDDTAWMEWRMRGTRPDGTIMEFAGVNIFGIEGDLIRWGRIYSELVREAGGISSQVQRMTGAG